MKLKDDSEIPLVKKDHFTAARNINFIIMGIIILIISMIIRWLFY